MVVRYFPQDFMHNDFSWALNASEQDMPLCIDDYYA